MSTVLVRQAHHRPPAERPGVVSFSGFTLLELMIAVVLIGVAAAMVLPGIGRTRRASNERQAASSVCALRKAQGDFKTNDRDANGIADFWTADVYGLDGLLAGGRPIRLIESALAAFDGLTRWNQYPNADFEGAVGPGREKSGYVVRSLHHSGPRSLLNGAGGCRDLEQFAFIAFPVSPHQGACAILMSEGNEVWKYNLPEGFEASFEGARGDDGSLSTTGGAGLAPELTLPASPGYGTFPEWPAAIGCSRPD